MTQQDSDGGKGEASAQGYACEGVPEVMQPDFFKACGFADALPGLLQVHEMTFLFLPSNDEGVVLVSRVRAEEFDSRLRQVDCFLSRLGVLKAELFFVEVDLGPAESANLIQPRAGEQEEPDGQNGVGAHLSFRLVLVEDSREGGHFVLAEKSFAGGLLESLDVAAGVLTVRDQAPFLSQVEHLGQKGQHPVRCVGLITQGLVEGLDVAPGDGREGLGAQAGADVALEVPAVVPGGGGLFLLLRMFLEVSVGEGVEGVGFAGGGPVISWVRAIENFRPECCDFLSGLIEGKFPDLCDGDEAPSPMLGAVPEDEGLFA